MAQHDITDLVARLTAAGHTVESTLLTGGYRIDWDGDRLIAHNRPSEASARRLVNELEATARRRAAARQADQVVAAGKVIFTKHRGDWVIVGPTDCITSGAVVDVSRASGETKNVEVLHVIGRNSRGVLATFADVLQASTVASRRPTNGSGTCVECGRYHRHLRLVGDSSGIPGLCCPRCAALDPVERSFA